jgi:hypothetical protein
VTISCDASQSGLGMVLLQGGKPVAYGSKSLSDAEYAYSQIEKELLAIVVACKKFHTYIYGRNDVLVETDHQPLLRIFHKPLHQVPLRLQRMIMRLQQYDFQIVHKSGKDIPVPDNLSRLHLPRNAESNDFQILLTDISSVHSVSPKSLEDIKNVTNTDRVMQKLSNVIKSGWPDYKQDLDFDLRQFWDHRDDLSLTDGIILKGQRIVIPHELQHQTLMKLHAAHQGMVRTKQLARDLVFWPGINSQIEDIVSRCASCQTFRNYQAKEPLIPLEAPSAPWSHIAIDLFTYDELKFVILVDYYSEWFEFEELSQTTAPKVINSVRKVFATHGIPQKVLTDNGPPFNSHTWSKFADDYGFAHITMSPKHSQTNGLVERAVGIVKSMLNKGPQDLTLALLNIRNTPHPTIGSPAQRLLGRRTRTVLPIQPDLLRPETLNPDAVQSAKTDQRNTAKQYYDRNAHELPTLKPGDSVRYRDENTKTWKPALLLPDRSQYPRSYQVVNPKVM